jgi:single-strand DNA-binding protein
VRVPDGTEVEVRGSLRRRFWRSPTGPASRYEVEVRSLRRT